MLTAPWWLETFRDNDHEAVKFQWLLNAQEEGKRGLEPLRQSWVYP